MVNAFAVTMRVAMIIGISRKKKSQILYSRADNLRLSNGGGQLLRLFCADCNSNHCRRSKGIDVSFVERLSRAFFVLILFDR